MSKPGIILIGGGGHCKSAIDVIEAENKFEIRGILDLKEKIGTKVLGYEILGTDEDILKFHNQGLSFHITLGQIKSAEARYKIYNNLKKISAKLPVICSPRAYVSRHARVEEGTIVMHNTIVNAGAHINVNCIINNNALIEHDTVVGKHCHISTAAVINGDCKIGDFTFIGSKSVLIHGVEISENCIAGAGTVVTKSWPKNTVLIGNPAKSIKI